MKAKLKKTGKIVDVWLPENSSIYRDMNSDLPYIVGELDFDFGEVDWEQRRYEIAKDVIAAHICSPIIPGIDPNPSVDALVRHGLMIADALIAELKKGGEQ